MRAAAGGLHIQEISATDSSVSEHDLTELVHPPPQLAYHGQLPAPAAGTGVRAVSSPHHGSSSRQMYDYPEGQASRVQQYLQEQHAYQNRSLPSPPVSSGSAPTVLQSFPSWDPTWRSGGVSEDGRAYTYHVPQSVVPANGLSPETRTSPRWQQDRPAEGSGAWNEEGANNVVEPYMPGWEAEYSEEDQKRFVEGEYRFGVGYDTSMGNSSGRTDKGITEERRAERLKALQKEFGKGHAVPQDPEVAEKGEKKKKKRSGKQKEKESFKAARAREKEEQARINAELGVGKDGRLVTRGPRQRAAMRWLQGILALVAVCGGIGGAILTHPAEDDDPGPSGSISTWALYVVSTLSFLVTFWTFAIRRCWRRKKDGQKLGQAQPGVMGMPIIAQHSYGPLTGGKVGKKEKGGWFKPGGSKGRAGQHLGQPMTVNLMIDPNALARLTSGGSRPPSRYDEVDELGREKRKKGHHEEADDGDSSETAFDPNENDDEEDADFSIPDSSKRRRSRPLGVVDAMQAMRLQDRWRADRKSMRRQMFQDGLLCCIWLAVSIWPIGFGDRCPPGTGAGWCDLYNTALACGVLLCVCFGASFVFCWLDLRRSRSVPRLTRV